MLTNESATSTATTYSLNLSPRYLPNWGAWEVAREIVSNALDADPEGMQVIQERSDTLRVITNTVPDLSDMFVIGAGTKGEGGDTIGQFGEGLKMAALVATRTQGGSLTLNIPGKTIEFYFDSALGADVLHAKVSPNPLHESGYEAILKLPNVSLAYAGRILPDKEEGPLPKVHSPSLRIYCKGIYICDINAVSIWDWRLNSASINRDRSMVSTFEATWEMGKWLCANMTDEQASQIVRHSESVEYQSAFDHQKTVHAANKLAAAFHRQWGPDTLIDSDNIAVTNRVLGMGFKVRPVSSASMTAILVMGGVKTADSVLPPGHDLEFIDSAPYRDQIDWLRSFNPIIGAPESSVWVYANHEDMDLGRAILEDRRVCLSQQLFTEGNRQKLLATYLHEQAHIISGAEDCTLKFEHSLTNIMGRLAMAVKS